MPRTLTTDGMLLAALVVIWVRRHRRKPVGVGAWAAFWAGMAATTAANLAAAQSTPVGIVDALSPCTGPAAVDAASAVRPFTEISSRRR